MATATVTESRPGTTAARPPRRRRVDYATVGLWIALVVSCIIWVLPFVFMILTSLKSQAEISSSSIWSLPKEWKWSNYADAAEKGNLSVVARNSAYIALIKV